jgi:hypothetical protein
MNEPLTRATFTVEHAREHFGYDPSLGRAIRLKNPLRGPKVAGQVAGTVHKPSGLYRVKFQGMLVYEHHLIWALVKGYWPYTRLKFNDGDLSNCHIENLCEETNTGSGDKTLQSSDVDYTNPRMSGVICTSSGRFKAQIYRGKMIYLGTFDTAEEASQAYVEAKKILHDPLNRDARTEDLIQP